MCWSHSNVFIRATTEAAKWLHLQNTFGNNIAHDKFDAVMRFVFGIRHGRFFNPKFLAKMILPRIFLIKWFEIWILYPFDSSYGYEWFRNRCANSIGHKLLTYISSWEFISLSDALYVGPNKTQIETRKVSRTWCYVLH